MLPKATYGGYIQSKGDLPHAGPVEWQLRKDIAIANLPLGVLVVDFLNMTKQNWLDLDPAQMARSRRDE